MTADATGTGPGHQDPALVGRTGECAVLQRLLQDARAGRGAALALRGEPGIGRTALLDHAGRQADGWRVVRAGGVESEVDLPYAGLHLLSGSVRDGLGRVPPAQREALEAALGSGTRAEPDRFLVSVATLTLLSEGAREQPLLCVVDDAQWLDRSTAQVLAFVARRLAGQPIALLIAHREPARLGELDGLPELVLGGLSPAAAHRLLGSRIPGRLDEAVVERIIAETYGNPRALLDLLQGMSPAELAGGFGVARRRPTDRLDRSLLDRVDRLPADSRRLLLAAAAEPLGDPTLQWRAAARLQIPQEAAEPLESDGLLRLGPRVTFCPPALRSAVYRAASGDDRRRVHRALAEATDPGSDPDRRAWHLARAAAGPDDELARELERRADTAYERGGLAAAATFLDNAASLTADPRLRPERALTAAAANHRAGAPDAAVRLLVTAELGPLDPAQHARLRWHRAQLSFARTRGSGAAALLTSAARELEPELAGAADLEALAAAISTGRSSRGSGGRQVAEATRAGPRAIDSLRDGLAARCAGGYQAGAAALKRALTTFREGRPGDEASRWLWLAGRVAADLWDDETWHVLSGRQLQLARVAGDLAVLPYALTCQAVLELQCGQFATAAALAAEADAVTAAVGSPRFADPPLLLAAWWGQEEQALQLFETSRQDATERGEGLILSLVDLSRAVLHNGLGRYAEAFASARDASALDELGICGPALAEQVEAAARSGDLDAAGSALDRLSERTRLGDTDWGLGVEARSRALVHDGDGAEPLYLEAIERLQKCRVRVDLARAQLVYGEWLRRRNRRTDARVPLREALDMFWAMGAGAFADRAHRELLATGEKAQSRTDVDPARLTAQESRIAALARDGMSNPEIAARLFVSPRTVEYHLHKVFGKLSITSRTELHLVLADA